MGEQGLQSVAQICYEGARVLRDELKAQQFNVYAGDDFFNEFFVEVNHAQKLCGVSQRILPGVPCLHPLTKKEGILVTVTELNRKYIPDLVNELVNWRKNNV